MNEALFVLSTGRCGTQWLADVFSRQLGEAAEVTHEPLDADYSARQMLAARDPAKLDSELAQPILEHVAHIEETLEHRDYIECGHPLWSTLPYLLLRFAGRVRVIHLVRHPVPTALSWVTQYAYVRPLAPHLAEKVLLSPFDEGVGFPSWRERWPALTPYEKALYYWAEVNAFGLTLELRANVPWLRLRLEDLEQDETFAQLLDFARAKAAALPRRPPAVDRFRVVLGFESEPRLVARHPDVIAVAARLGYDPLAYDKTKLRMRYSGMS